MANFSALSEVRYDYIKVARDLFIMLRQTPEGRNLFTLLLQLMNRYCQGVIVEAASGDRVHAGQRPVPRGAGPAAPRQLRKKPYRSAPGIG